MYLTPKKNLVLTKLLYKTKNKIKIMIKILNLQLNNNNNNNKIKFIKINHTYLIKKFIKFPIFM